MITGAMEAGLRSGVKRAETAARRASLVLNLHIAGLTKAEIARRLNVSPRTVFRALADVGDERIQVEDLIEDCGLDATDIHITLSRMHDADISDIVVNPEDPIEEFRYKTIGQWPLIWRQGLAGKIRITPVSVRSTDGVQAGDNKAWDQIGYKVEIERESLLKILELSARLKAVDAMVQQKAGDINIAVVTAETARKVTGARKRLEKVIDVTPEKAE